jgi:hypothetical protein
MRISLDNIYYRAHRLAWLYVHDVWPDDQIDHINGCRDDNRIANLREVTNAQNMQNLHRPHSRNTSGYLGVHFVRERNRWGAQIRDNGRKRNLGHFATAEEASAAYLAAKRELHPFWHDVA